VLQCIAVCCSALQHVAVCCAKLVGYAREPTKSNCCSVLWGVAMCCSVLQHIAACCSAVHKRHRVC